MTRKDDSWLVLIDTSECGKLEEGVRLRPFRETGDVAHLTQEVWVANKPTYTENLVLRESWESALDMRSI